MEDLVLQLKTALNSTLPGVPAHDRMMRTRRPTPAEIRATGVKYKDSAVLVLLFPIDSVPHTVLMLRPSYDGVHSGQVSFPGGKAEPQDDSLLETALREAEEEISVDRKSVTLLGTLTELYIPPSRFIVHPYVAYVESQPSFVPDPIEVEKVISTPLSRLLADDVIKEKEIFLPKYNTTIEASYFDIENEVVWGATAMMLAEFREILLALDWKSK